MGQNNRTGRAYISIDSVLYETMLGATIEGVGGVDRQVVKGSEVFGFAAEAKAPTITCKFAHSSGVSLAQLDAVENATVTFACDTGTTIGVYNAWSSGVKLTATVDGGVECTFTGKSAKELLS